MGKAVVLYGEYPYDELCAKIAHELKYEVWPLTTNPNASLSKMLRRMVPARVVELQLVGQLVRDEYTKAIALVTVAAAYAEEVGAETLFFGFNTTVHFRSQHEMCPPRKFYDSAEAMLNSVEGKNFRILTPLMFKTEDYLKEALKEYQNKKSGA
jgi:hypothetical protein